MQSVPVQEDRCMTPHVPKGFKRCFIEDRPDRPAFVKFDGPAPYIHTIVAHEGSSLTL